MLAQKQIERAAQLTEQAHASQELDGTPSRGVKTEQEMLLLYDIIGTHGNTEDMAKLISSPVFSPLAQFRMGRKELFQRVGEIYVKQQQWEQLCALCHSCLSDIDEAGEANLLACDWSIWKQYINAAAHVENSNAEYVPGLSHGQQRC